MRLLDVHTFPPPPPDYEIKPRRYAILSHTWEENEVVLSDITKPKTHNTKADSWRKIRGAQREAAKDGYDFIWIDTVRIAKSSSAELSEAINSMYRYYQQAEVCYVYLSDVDKAPVDCAGGFEFTERHIHDQFAKSRWFKRGWTLQELLAPSTLRFFDKNWNFIGNLEDLSGCVSKVTHIQVRALDITKRRPLSEYSIAQRMSWAAGRETTRPEDRAYSLLGIFDVSLGIRYGEGHRAFIRLQEEIISRTIDDSLFAWGKHITEEEQNEMDVGYQYRRGDLLAPSPDSFADAGSIVPSERSGSYYKMTNKGLEIDARVLDKKQILLSCRYIDDPSIAILLNLRSSQITIPSNSKGSRLSIENVKTAANYSAQDHVIIETNKSPALAEEHLLLERTEFLVALWVVGERPQASEEDYELYGPCEDEPFLLEESWPPLDESTRVFTHALPLGQKPDVLPARQDFVLHLEHPTGQAVVLRCGTWSPKNKRQQSCFAYLDIDIFDSSCGQPLAVQHDVERAWVELKYRRRYYTRDNDFSVKCIRTLNKRLAIMATLQQEELSGEQRYVLEISTRFSPLGMSFRIGSIELDKEWLECRTRRSRKRAVICFIAAVMSAQILLLFLRWSLPRLHPLIILLTSIISLFYIVIIGMLFFDGSLYFPYPRDQVTLWDFAPHTVDPARKRSYLK